MNSMANDNSVDLMAKFADLAAQIAEDTKHVWRCIEYDKWLLFGWLIVICYRSAFFPYVQHDFIIVYL